jgi:hypothetical protein
MTIFLELVAVAALVLLNGYFVAAEYALVTVRRTRLNELAQEGHRRAKLVLRLTQEPPRFIAAMQLGVTVTSLAIGALGEHALTRAFHPVLATVLAVILAYLILTFLHVVIGELVPKAVALRYSERTALALSVNGYDVVVPAERVCCGALASHAGEANTAERLAAGTMEAFGRERLDVVIVNAAGCGSNMKEYEVQLRRDERRREAGATFSRTVKDASEFLIDKGMRPPTRRMRLQIAYQDPCHLLHGQKVHQQPRQVLKMIPGVELVEMKEPDWCCGSAGVYNLTHPEISEEALASKVRHIVESGAQVIASANPGCILQIGMGLQRAGHDVPIMHVMDLLGWAYGDDSQRPPVVRRAMA